MFWEKQKKSKILITEGGPVVRSEEGPSRTVQENRLCSGEHENRERHDETENAKLSRVVSLGRGRPVDPARRIARTLESEREQSASTRRSPL